LEKQTASLAVSEKFGKISTLAYLYVSLVMATMLYSAELCPLTIKHMKTLEAAHHKFQRRLLGIKWYDRVSNVEVRKRTGTAKLEELIKERRLRWLVHVRRMEDCRIPNQREQETRKTPEKMAGHHPKTGFKGHRIDVG